MKKTIAKILAIALILPSFAFATAPGYAGDTADCVPWREGMGPYGEPNYNGQGFCTTNNSNFKRLYDLEVDVEALKTQNRQLESRINQLENRPTQAQTQAVGQTVVTQVVDQATVQRVTNLEVRMSAGEKAINFIQTQVSAALTSISNNLKTLLNLLQKK